MLYDSLFYRMFMFLWCKFKLFYENSMLCKIAEKFFGFIMGIWSQSFIRHLLFDDLGMEKRFRSGFFGKTARIENLFDITSSKCRNAVFESAAVSKTGKVMSALPHYSTATYGLFFALIGGIKLLSRFFGRLQGTAFILAIGFLGFGILLIIINRSLSRLYNGSTVLKTIGGFFFKDAELGIKEDEVKGNYALFAVLGIIFGLAGAFLPFQYFILGLGGFIGALLVLYKVEIGIYALAFLMPLMPTMFILGISVLVVLSYFIKVVFTGEHKLSVKLLDFFVAAFLLIILYSVVISYIPKSSLIVAAVYTLFLLTYFAVKNVINTKDKLYTVISILCVSGFLVSLYGVYQRYSGSYISAEAWLDTDMFENMSGRVYSTLDNPNVLGEHLLFVIPMAFGMLYYMKKPFYKLITIGILATACVCMILTLSRGAWLGLIIALIVFVFLKDRRLLWLGLIALLIMPFVLPPSIIERFSTIGNMSDGSTAYRVNIWMASLKMLGTFWPIGIGLSTDVFVFIYQKFAFNAVYAPHSHNLYLQILIDLGIGGFTAFVLILFGYFKNLLVSISSKSKRLTAISASLCAGMLGYLVQGMTDNVFYNYRIVLYFWVIIALGGSIAATIKSYN